jgi:hypothetical protein
MQITRPSVSKDDFNSFANSVSNLVQAQSVKLGGLTGQLTDLSTRVDKLIPVLDSLKSQLARNNPQEPAAGMPDKAVFTNQLETLKESLGKVAAETKDIKDQMTVLQSTINTANIAITELKSAGQGAATFNSQFTALTGKINDLSQKVDNLKNLAGKPGGGSPVVAGKIDSLWVLMVINLVIGTGALGVSVVLLWLRKSVTTQVQSLVAAQVNVVANSLMQQVQPKLDAAFQQFQPKLDAVIKQEQELGGELRKATANQQEFLNSMKTKQEELLQTLMAESKSLFGQLKQEASAEFLEFFQGVRNSWNVELEKELKKVREGWGSTLQATQNDWQKRLEGEVATLKELWVQQLDEHLKEWQARLNSFVESQPELWQKRMDQATVKSGTAWDHQLSELEAKTAGFWSGIEQRLEAAQAGINRLNSEIGDSFERLKLRDEVMTTLVWPACFHEGGALAGWKKQIEDRLAQHDAGAFDLFLALGRFNNAIREPGDARKVAEVVHGVGVEAYRFWKAQGGAELNAALEWRTAFQGSLDAANIPIDIILALERERFDTNTMLSVEAGSAGRMYVKEALSWIVRDKSSDPPKVLCHARVITC